MVTDPAVIAKTDSILAQREESPYLLRANTPEETRGAIVEALKTIIARGYHASANLASGKRKREMYLKQAAAVEAAAAFIDGIRIVPKDGK
jgi:hypothetical protein